MSLASQVIGAVVLWVTVVVLITRWGAVTRTVRGYFTEPGPAFNLAVFRVLFFTAALWSAHVPLSVVKQYAALPDGLVAAPWGMRHVAPHLPMTPGLVQVAFAVAVATSITTAIGLMTRTSAALFLLSAGYYLTIPQMFGKVNHYHLTLYVAALFVVCRSADTFSVDAMIRGWRHPERRRLEPSRAYALPLRLVWLMLGLAYFFPGLHKYVETGVGWASPDNMRAIMWNKWAQLDGWHPFFPADKFGPMLTLWAAGTMLFELTFLPLIFTTRTRRVPAVCGLVFHNMTYLVLRIGFLTLQVLYLSFVNWLWLCERLAGRLGVVAVQFDRDCALCRKAVAVLEAVSLPTLVTFDGVAAPDVFRAVHRGRSFDEFEAYRRLAWRVPPLWLALPFLYLSPIAALGRRVYARVSLQRSCSLEPPRQAEPAVESHLRLTSGPVGVVGGLLAAGMIYAGCIGYSGWPLSVFPTFAGHHVFRHVTVEAQVVAPDGSVHRLSMDRALSWVTPAERRSQLLGAAVRDAQASDGPGPAALIHLLEQGSARRQVAAAREIRFFVVTQSTFARDAQQTRSLLLVAKG